MKERESEGGRGGGGLRERQKDDLKKNKQTKTNKVVEECNMFVLVKARKLTTNI